MRRIVVGADAGPAGVAALQWALAEAVRTQTPLVAVRAWTSSAFAMGYAGAFATGDGELPEQAEAQSLADEQIKLACSAVAGADTVDTSVVVQMGSSAQVLLDTAGPDDLLVVGTRGHGALSRAVMGSVSSSVLHHAHGSVAIVPEPRTHDDRPPRVVVGVDHSPRSLAALAVAAEQARRRGAVLVPVYAHQPLVGDVPGISGGHHDLAALEAVERRSLELFSVEADGKPGAAEVAAEVVVGHAGAALTDLTRPQDLLVVGSRGRGGFAALLLGSTSTQCVQHATCPVLVVR